MEGLDRWSLHIRVIFYDSPLGNKAYQRGQRSSNGRNRPKSTLLYINWFIRFLLSQITVSSVSAFFSSKLFL